MNRGRAHAAVLWQGLIHWMVPRLRQTAPLANTRSESNALIVMSVSLAAINHSTARVPALIVLLAPLHLTLVPRHALPASQGTTALVVCLPVLLAMLASFQFLKEHHHVQFVD